jgi:hypothetical protein
MRQPLSRLGRTAVVVPGIAAALILTGCKDGQGAAEVQPSDQASQPAQTATPATPGSQSPTSQPAAPPLSTAKTKLTITVRAAPTAKPTTRTLTCDPPGGTVPHAADACAALAKAAKAKGDPFAPTPKGQMCTQIYGGPEVATVKGTWNGKPVDATFGRKNGCELKRWNDLAPLFGPVPPVR